jgi:shikimate kinase
MLSGVNLYLIGMMGAGKSTVGRLLAAELGYGFLDLDELIEKVSGLSVSEIFANHGEAAFRKLESDVLAQVAPFTRMVVATGGGVVVTQGNWGHLRHGVVLWLDASVETLVRRLEKRRETRPLLGSTDDDLQARLESLLAARRNLYSQADLCVDANSPVPLQVARHALEKLAQRLAEDHDRH